MSASYDHDVRVLAHILRERARTYRTIVEEIEREAPHIGRYSAIDEIRALDAKHAAEQALYDHIDRAGQS